MDQPEGTVTASLLHRTQLDSPGKTNQVRKYATIIGSLAIALAAVFGSAHEVSASMEHSGAPAIEVAELAPVITSIEPAAITVDAEAILELSNLLNQFIPLAQAHGIEFDYGLVEALHQQSERVGISLPVTINVPGATNFHTTFGVSSLHLPDEAAELANKLAGATQAWVTTLTQATTVTRAMPRALMETDQHATDELEASEPPQVFDASGRFAYAPASRGGVRAGQPVTVTAVRELAQEFDTWVGSEAEAAAASSANFRARMVALSRAHGNGRLPQEALCPIPFSPRFTMRCDVIDSLVELNNAFRAHFGRDVVVRSGYRANPGTSNHGWGLAVDFGGGLVNFGTAEFNWMNANARQFGWGHAFWAVPGGLNPQPWHWEAMDEIREMTGSWR